MLFLLGPWARPLLVCRIFNPVFGLAGFTLELQDGLAILRLDYHVNDEAIGHYPALALTPEQARQARRRRQRQVIEIKQRENVVTSFGRQ